jgi:drug/metabolite transporter (DMT)-like permease
LIGVVFIILGGQNGLDFSSKYMLGNMLALLISLLGALFNLMCMPLMKKYSALRVSTWYIFFGSLFMFPATWGRWGHVEWTSLPLIAWSAVAYNVLMCTVVAFVIWNLCMSRVGATKANFYRYIVPAAATLAGALFFAEPILPLQIAGGIVIVLGLFWISLEKIREIN